MGDMVKIGAYDVKTTCEQNGSYLIQGFQFGVLFGQMRLLDSGEIVDIFFSLNAGDDLCKTLIRLVKTVAYINVEFDHKTLTIRSTRTYDYLEPTLIKCGFERDEKYQKNAEINDQKFWFKFS